MITTGTLPISYWVGIVNIENTLNASYLKNIFSDNGNNNSPTCLLVNENDYLAVKNNEFSGCLMGVNGTALNSASISNNYFYSNFRHLHYTGSGDDNVISNNVFAKAVFRTLTAYGFNSHSRWAIYNNTFYDDSNIYTQNIFLGNTEELDFYNNIIVSNRSPQFITGGYFNTPTQNSMDHNQFSTPTFQIELRSDYASASYYSLADWQASSELIGGGNPGVGSLSSDPLFVNTSGNFSELGDFVLSAGSPSIGAGRNGVDMGADLTQVGPDAP